MLVRLRKNCQKSRHEKWQGVEKLKENELMSVLRIGFDYSCQRTYFKKCVFWNVKTNVVISKFQSTQRIIIKTATKNFLWFRREIKENFISVE